MTLFKQLLYAAFIVLITAFAFQQSSNMMISNDYFIQFSGNDANGVFKNLSGDIYFDEQDLSASRCVLIIDVNSINTGNGTKNKHAKSKKWFDAEKYPTIEFWSKQFTKTADGYAVAGTMSIHGIEKYITIPFTFIEDVFESEFSVNRLDYNIGTMEGNSKNVSNEIRLKIIIPVTKI